MLFNLEASGGTHIGRIRQINQDNLFFDGKILEQVHENLLPPCSEKIMLKGNPVSFSIFDGMGGESAGEIASFFAAETMKKEIEQMKNSLISGKVLLEKIYQKINQRICDECVALDVESMGSTGVSLLFTADEVYVCNLGDSKAFLCRDNMLTQLSEDHVALKPAWDKSKPGLVQYFGVSPEEITLEPTLIKKRLKKGDQYLICSDGLTDMVSNIEICDILKERQKATDLVVKTLIRKALDSGGKDNVTAILCRII